MIRSSPHASSAATTILAPSLAIRFPQWKQRKKFMPAPCARDSGHAKIESGGSTGNAKKVRNGNRNQHNGQSAESAGSEAGSHPRRNRPAGLSHLSPAPRRARKPLRGLETG